MKQAASGIAIIAGLLVACAPVLAAEQQTYHLIPGTLEPGRQPDGNTVILDAPDGLIVVDTGRHAAHQDAILAYARTRGRPIAAIVNTHWHLDHSGGNAELRAVHPNAEINTSGAIEGALAGFLAKGRERNSARLADGDAAMRTEIEGDIAAVDERVSLLPTRPVTASGTVTIAGRNLDVRLAPFAATAGDVWIYDDTTRLVIVGDLVVDVVPFMDTACVSGWQAALAEIARTPFKTLIPGHGTPMDRAAFTVWRTAFDNFVACGASAAEDARCIDGWRRDAAPFVARVDPKRVDAMVGYYLKSRLRAPPAERDRYCAPTAS